MPAANRTHARPAGKRRVVNGLFGPMPSFSRGHGGRFAQTSGRFPKFIEVEFGSRRLCKKWCRARTGAFGQPFRFRPDSRIAFAPLGLSRWPIASPNLCSPGPACSCSGRPVSCVREWSSASLNTGTCASRRIASLRAKPSAPKRANRPPTPSRSRPAPGTTAAMCPWSLTRLRSRGRIRGKEHSHPARMCRQRFLMFPSRSRPAARQRGGEPTKRSQGLLPSSAGCA